jgi:hypothetical protein
MRVIEAERKVAASRQSVHEFLADVASHAVLSDSSIELLEADDRHGRSRGVVRVNPPLPIDRTVVTEMREKGDPVKVEGVARMGRRVVAEIVWELQSCDGGTSVTLRATLGRTRFRDRVLLWLGGAYWLKRRFCRVLRRLERSLSEPERASACRQPVV